MTYIISNSTSWWYVRALLIDPVHLDYNIVINATYRDVRVLFEPLYRSETIHYYYGEVSPDLLDVLVQGKFFTSKSQARKAGWSSEIPEGFTQWTIGKYKRTLTVYNKPRDDWELSI